MSASTGAFDSTSSKMNFMKGFIRLAKADGVLADAEQKVLLTVAENFGLPSNNIEELLSLMMDDQAEMGITFENKRQAILFFYQAIQLCFVDGDFSKSERAEIAKISSEVGVPQESIDQIENWVVQGKTWVQTGETLIAKLSS